jgi:hypothetical protein
MVHVARPAGLINISADQNYINVLLIVLTLCLIDLCPSICRPLCSREFPNKMLVTVTQCLFSTVQSFLVAVVAERDFSMWKLRLDISLLAVVYSVNFVFDELINYCIKFYYCFFSNYK